MNPELSRSEKIRLLSKLERDKTTVYYRIEAAHKQMTQAFEDYMALIQKWSNVEAEQNNLIQMLQDDIVPAPKSPVVVAPPAPAETPAPVVEPPATVEVPSGLNAKDQMVYALVKLADLDSTGTFLQRLSDHPKCRGTSRHYVAKDPAEIYSVPELRRFVAGVQSGWFVATNLSNRDKLRLLTLASEVARKQIKVHFQ